MILGIDPGGRWWGWCLLDGGAFVDAGVLDLAELGETVLLVGALKLAARADVVAFERPGGVAPGIVRVRPAAASQASAEIADASWLGGELRGHCAARGQRTHAFPAAQWRRHFFGQANADDAAVAVLVRSQVQGWPARLAGSGGAYGARGWLLSQRQSHARDAAAVALYAATLGAP